MARVSFVVPCYRLAAYLDSCVHSILRQTYEDLEVLVMDDCSPDNTEEVAKAISDKRVRYIRNETNLGHLRNYNRGIQLATGDFVWLISADDRLRSRDVLERYMAVLEEEPRVGYAFCPGIGIVDGKESGVIEWATLDCSSDCILPGRRLLRTLLKRNRVLAPSGLARRECYEKVGLFPDDFPYSGDWYLWCAFAMFFDVAYFQDPMVNYRLHDQSMTGAFNAHAKDKMIREEFAVRWRMLQIIREEDSRELAEHAFSVIVSSCVKELTEGEGSYGRGMKLEEFSDLLNRHAIWGADRIRLLETVGENLLWRGQTRQARRVLADAIAAGSRSPKLAGKFAWASLHRLWDGR